MQYAPLPTEEQLARVREAIGAGSLAHVRRLDGGLSCTMDVLSEGSTRLILRRYGSWAEGSGDSVALKETRALELMQRANIPAPAPIWVDSEGVFDEQAVVISFIDGKPDLTPADPFDWAEKLAAVLSRIHDVRVGDDDLEQFPPGAGHDIEEIQEHPELVLEHPLGEELLRRRVMLGQRSVETESVFSHTDYWPGNTLWSDGDLVAVVDWESPSVNDPAMDVAYASLDIRYLGMDRVADRFIASYREISGRPLVNLDHWEAVGLCRPMPDIGEWSAAWKSMGRDVPKEKARARYNEVLEGFLARTS